MNNVVWVWRLLRGLELEVAELTDDQTRIQKMRRQYCADAIIILGVIEAFSIIVVGAFLLSVPINFAGVPGSEALSQKQLGINIVVQLFGELLVTDGIVAYLSAKWAKSYPVDISVYWHRRDRVVYGAALVLISVFPLSPLQGFAGFTCFTSKDVGDGLGIDKDYVLQICPLPVNITDMASVGEKFLEAFRIATEGG